MYKKGPIIIVDDDEDDRQLSVSALNLLKIKNKVLTFNDGVDALKYLKTTKDNPFLIVCDLKMNRMDGLTLLEEINRNVQLKEKSIPFIILSGSADTDDVRRAFQLSVQGFFVKPGTVEELVAELDLLIRYWQRCREPGTSS